MSRRLCDVCCVMFCAAVALLGGCGRESVQSSLDAAGPNARAIATLWWVMFWVCTAVFVLVLLLTLGAIFRGRSRSSAQRGAPLSMRFVVISGFILPAVVLVGFLLASIPTTNALRATEPPALTIRVIAKQWWWEVMYPELGIVTANELHIPAGRPVRIELVSDNVIHSFWVPRLSGKMDVIPDVATSLTLQADAPGRFRGQCAEYCGTQHALMAFWVVALSPEEFEQWAARNTQPPAPPATPHLLHGQSVFVARCAACHAARGTDAQGRIGPDLTHLASRLTLGAATIPNTRDHLAAWILNPQSIKPGNLMPPVQLPSEDLDPLLDYLERLR